MPEYRTYGARDDRISKDGDVGFIGFNNRLRPDQLQQGLLADAQNIRLDRNAEAQVRKGVELVTAPLAIGVDALSLPFDLPTAGQIGDGITAILDDDAVNAIYGSCGYSDPNASASQYIIIAANTKAIAINIATKVETDIAYPLAVTVGQPVDMIQAFNKVYIFREGRTALEWDGDFSGTPAFTKVPSGDYTQPIQIVCAAGDFALINGRGIVHQSDGVSVGDKVSCIAPLTLSTDQTSGLKIGELFTVSKIFTGGATQSITSATSTLISGGEFDGLNKVTVTVTGHGYDIGDPIDVSGYASPDTDINGARFVAEKTTDTFVFYVDGTVSSSPSAGTPVVALAHGFEFFFNSNQTDVHITDGLSLLSTPVFSRPLSVGLGFTHMPAPPFAIYHQRRLAMPFKFSVDTAVDSFTSRDILDEVIISEPLDSDTYDQIYAQYRFNAGTADFVVGLHSFAEDTLLVFNRNSIHTIFDTLVLANSKNRLLTNEVGCVARKSIVQVGNQVIFLSDNGVYGIQFLDEYNLRGTETPLSEPINETIKRINKNSWENSVATYFDNRYFISVPIDGATSNNAILVYNFLTKQWESVDQVNDANFHSTNLIVVGNGDDRAVYAVNDIGGVHRLEKRVDGIDRVITQIGGTQQNLNVNGSVTTRQYTLGSLERKRWKEFELHVQSSEDNTSDFDISAETENPDATVALGSLEDFNGTALAINEDVSIRGRIGNRRGYGIQFTINNTSGRPRIRAIDTDGSVSFRSSQKAD